jgi:CO/xanthine dehydrogenase Mo-binding subunit
LSGAAPTRIRPADRVGESPSRPDGTPKVMGEFAYSSDLWADRMLWGTTLRSPHPYARIRSLDVARALALPGVRAVLTHEDVPGRKTYGLEVPDQPVLAIDVVRYQGEPVAIVAADHPETARRAAGLIEVDYEVLEPLVDMELAVTTGEPRLHEDGNVLRRIHVRHGDVAAAESLAEVVVEGEYELGMRIKPSSARSPDSRSLPRTAESTSTWRRSGSTSTVARSPPAWDSRRNGCVSRWRGWAGRSGVARTFRCRRTLACSPSTPGGR